MNRTDSNTHRLFISVSVSELHGSVDQLVDEIDAALPILETALENSF